MPTIEHIVSVDQNYVDIALQYFGSKWVEGLMELTEQGIIITDIPIPGQVIELKNVPEFDLDMQYLAKREITVATGSETITVIGPIWIDGRDNQVIIDTDNKGFLINPE